jgi:hypothetical protein
MTVGSRFPEAGESRSERTTKAAVDACEASGGVTAESRRVLSIWLVDAALSDHAGGGAASAFLAARPFAAVEG